MGIIAANIIVGGTVTLSAPRDVVRTGEGSFQSLREKAYKQIEQQLPKNKVVEVMFLNPPPKKIREVDDTLIQYKESAFLSDMLSSSKD